MIHSIEDEDLRDGDRHDEDCNCDRCTFCPDEFCPHGNCPDDGCIACDVEAAPLQLPYCCDSDTIRERLLRVMKDLAENNGIKTIGRTIEMVEAQVEAERAATFPSILQSAEDQRRSDRAALASQNETFNAIIGRFH